MTEPVRLDPRDAAIKKSEATLIASASAAMQDALDAWIYDDHRRVSVNAPYAVELLGKAALWHESPMLLMPLTNQSEVSLFILAQKPDLTTSGLRTIGLSTVLSRLDKLLGGGLPLDGKQRARLADTRNGALHVGTQEQTRYVMTDAITVCSLLLPRLDRTASAFYGAHSELVAGLAQERRSEVEHRVATKRARARSVFLHLEESLEETELEEVTSARSAAAEYELEPDQFSATHALEQECPECEFAGRVFGDVEVNHEVEYDYEQLPDGDIEPTLISDYYTVSFIPKAFACYVCKLELSDRDELQAGGLDTDPKDIEESDLGYGFNAQRYVEDRYGDLV